MECVCDAESFRTSYWSPGHAVAVTAKAEEGFGLVEAGRHGCGDGGVAEWLVVWQHTELIFNSLCGRVETKEFAPLHFQFIHLLNQTLGNLGARCAPS